MDQPLSSLFFTPSLLTLILFFSITFIISYRKSKPNKNLPPGPWRLPIIGNLHQVISSCPHRHLANIAKKYGPMMHLQLGQVPHLIVWSAEAAMEVMKIHDLAFAGRPRNFVASTITYNYKDLAFGDYWRWLRKICVVDLLSTKRVQSFRYIREEEVSSMVESIRVGSFRGSTVDIKEVFLALTSSVTARASFGKSSKETNAAYTSLVKRISDAFGGFHIADFFPSVGFLPAVTGLKSKILKLFREVDEVLENIIEEHRAGMVRDGDADNLLDLLLGLQERGGDRLEFPLTTEHIKAIIFDLFCAGTETSSTVMEWTISELMASPTTMKKVQNEPRQAFRENSNIEESRLHNLKYFNAAIKEALRLHPPFTLLLPRKVRGDVTVKGYEVSEGTTVVVNAWAIGRDPKYWNEPDRFCPERFFENSVDYNGTYFQFIPFGAGRRMCAGMQFGVANIEVALANLLYHFDWELPDGLEAENLEMSDAFGISTGRKVPLHLKAIPRNPDHSKTK